MYCESDALVMEVLRNRIAELENEEAELAAIFASAPTGLAVLDSQLRVLRANRVLGKVIGQRKGTGYSIREAAPELARSLELLVQNVLNTGEPVINAEITGEVAGGKGAQRHWLATLYAITGYPNAGARIVLAIMDMTRAKTEQEHQKEAAKFETIGRLAGGIAHEFNNLLVGIMGGASMALDELPESHPVRPMLDVVLRASNRAAELTRQLLAFSGKGRFVTCRFSLNSVVQETCNRIRQTIPGSVELVVDTQANLPPLAADPEQVEEMVRSMVLNAAEAIGESGGAIRISTKLERLHDNVPACACHTGELAPGLYLVLEVSDTGCGMDQETQTKVFDPFFTTKFPGRGLGLAAVHGIVHSLNGAVQVASAPGRGSTFRVLLRAGSRSVAACGSQSPAR